MRPSCPRPRSGDPLFVPMRLASASPRSPCRVPIEDRQPGMARDLTAVESAVVVEGGDVGYHAAVGKVNGEFEVLGDAWPPGAVVAVLDGRGDGLGQLSRR